MARVRNAGAIMAAAGRKKYGAARMAKWAAAGRRRAKRGGKRTNRLGGGLRFKRGVAAIRRRR